MYITWSDSLLTGIKEVDDQHKELIRIINKLHKAFVENKNVEAMFQSTISELVDYTVGHFATEEKLMDAAKMPEIEHHKNEHEHLIDIVQQQLKLMQQKTISVKSFIVFLKKWVLSHVAKTDRKMGDFLITTKQFNKHFS